MQSTLVNRIDYCWGLFESTDRIDPSRVEIAGSLVRPDIPGDVMDSLLEERISELEGDFGDPTVGDPIEVDLLTLETDTVPTVQLFYYLLPSQTTPPKAPNS